MERENLPPQKAGGQNLAPFPLGRTHVPMEPARGKAQKKHCARERG